MTAKKTPAKPPAGKTAAEAAPPDAPKRSKLFDLIASIVPPQTTVAIALGEPVDGEAQAQEFRLRAVGSLAWGDLLAAHPPKPPQQARQPRLDHNPETFPFAAVSACLVDPPASADEVRDLAGRLSQGQWLRLWQACLSVNLGTGP